MSTYLLGNVLAFAPQDRFTLSLSTVWSPVLAAGRWDGKTWCSSRGFWVGQTLACCLLPFCLRDRVHHLHGGFPAQRPLSELRFLLGRANLLIIVVLLLPFSLTLSLAWSCKDAVLRQLSALDRPRDSGPTAHERLPSPLPRIWHGRLVVLLLMETAVFSAQTNALPRHPLVAHHELGHAGLLVGLHPDCRCSHLSPQGHVAPDGSPRIVRGQCVLSVAFWCLFEAYNRVMPGWRYLHLDSDLSVRMLGYAVSFATIMPGLFLTCELLQSYDILAHVRLPSLQWSQGLLGASVALGVVFVVAPPFLPENTRGYLWVFVWLGWFLLLEPFNYCGRARASIATGERGDWSRTLQLLVAGAICGFLWEFWNMWAYTKWVYLFPMATARNSLRCR